MCRKSIPPVSFESKTPVSTDKGILSIDKDADRKTAKNRKTMNQMTTEEIAPITNPVTVRRPLAPNFVRQSTIRTRTNVPRRISSRRYSENSENIPPVRFEPKTPVSTVRSTSVRKSSILKNVEIMAKHREERRLQHVKERAKKSILKNTKLQNSYWDLLNLIYNFQKTLKFCPLSIDDDVLDLQIKVILRQRPLNNRELMDNEIEITSITSNKKIILHEPKTKLDLSKYLHNHHFTFDHVFSEKIETDVIHKYATQPLITTVLDGGIATCIAYGPTGTGKTHTMAGKYNGKYMEYNNGLYMLTAKNIFEQITSSRYKLMNFRVFVSIYEIHGNHLYDLITKTKELRGKHDDKQIIRTSGLLSKILVENQDQFDHLLKQKVPNRTSSQTSANINSSRSHVVLDIILFTPGIKTPYGTYRMVDLAGNERDVDTSSANRQARIETTRINKALLTLKECIRAFEENKSYIPCRASKLTQVLSDSFTNRKAKICLIATLSPGIESCEESIKSLRYAASVKEIGAANRNTSDESMSTDQQTCKKAIAIAHNKLTTFIDNAIPKWEKLLETTNDVNYNKKIYIEQWEKYLTDAINILHTAHQRLNSHIEKKEHQ